MEKINQQKIWDLIASEWHKYKIKPAKNTEIFLKKQHGKILDLGSGSGRNLIKIPKSKIYLVDFSAEMLKLAGKKSKQNKIQAEFIQSKLTKLPFKENFFDSAICISALHCVEGEKNREKTVKELFRVLKLRATALVSVWNKNSKRFKNKKKENFIGWRDKGKRYYYLYDEKEIHNLFKKIGFKIIDTKNSEMMINFIVEKP